MKTILSALYYAEKYEEGFAECWSSHHDRYKTPEYKKAMKQAAKYSKLRDELQARRDAEGLPPKKFLSKPIIETIKHAAVKSSCGTIIIYGKQHADCFKSGDAQQVKMSRKAKDQGFITSTGRYVDREEGFKIALAAKQITGTGNGGVLGSEDLWSPRHNGTYSYDPVQGYFK